MKIIEDTNLTQRKIIDLLLYIVIKHGNKFNEKTYIVVKLLKLKEMKISHVICFVYKATIGKKELVI